VERLASPVAREFPVVLVWDPDEQVWNVSVPNIAGCFTWGRTLEEALQHAEEAIDVNLEDMQARGETLPDSRRVMVGTVIR